jgi:cytochrome c biogenesis protein CcdA
MTTAFAASANIGQVPGWARWAARTIPLLVIPSGLWRVALGVGVPVGFTGDLAELYRAPGWITPYVLALTLAIEVAALMALGLVHAWGEVVPRWVPHLGGRRVPMAVGAAIAAAGVVCLAAIAVPTVALWNGPENMGDPDAPQGVAGLVMTACYAPMLAWPLLLAALTVHYFRRRRTAAASNG